MWGSIDKRLEADAGKGKTWRGSPRSKRLHFAGNIGAVDVAVDVDVDVALAVAVAVAVAAPVEAGLSLLMDPQLRAMCV